MATGASSTFALILEINTMPHGEGFSCLHHITWAFEFAASSASVSRSAPCWLWAACVRVELTNGLPLAFIPCNRLLTLAWIHISWIWLWAGIMQSCSEKQCPDGAQGVASIAVACGRPVVSGVKNRTCSLHHQHSTFEWM